MTARTFRLSVALAYLPLTLQQASASEPTVVAPTNQAVPAAPTSMPPPPSAPDAPTTTSVLPGGQWIYTTQYGWIWMPYGTTYRHVRCFGNGPPCGWPPLTNLARLNTHSGSRQLVRPCG